MKRVLTALLFLLTLGPRAGLAGPEQRTAEIPVIIDRPIRFDAERVRLTVEYRRVHQDARALQIARAVQSRGQDEMPFEQRARRLDRLENGDEIARTHAERVQAILF